MSMGPRTGESAGCWPGCLIRTATSADAAGIHGLMVEAFGQTYLPFSIFQASASVNFIQELISQGFVASSNAFVVAETGARIVGYYHAVRRGDGFFLNYIASARQMAGQGLGNMLASHFDAMGSRVGCATLGLDVFRSNHIAMDWYLRRHFQFQSSTFHVRILLEEVSLIGAPDLVWPDHGWRAATQEEQARGFSKVDCACGPGSIQLGLIDGVVCKLLSWDGVSMEDAVHAVARKLRNRRAVLVVSRLPALPQGLPLERAEEALRLVKAV